MATAIGRIPRILGPTTRGTVVDKDRTLVFLTIRNSSESYFRIWIAEANESAAVTG
jgi:hypothetical protein